MGQIEDKPDSAHSWSRRWAQRIGENVQKARRQQGIPSAHALSERCQALGRPIPRSTIANLEAGRKESVPVHEVVVLARALDVPPVRLLFPLDDETSEPLPGVTTHPWMAVKWFVGSEPLPGQDREAFTKGALHIELYRWHETFAQTVRSNMNALGSHFTLARWDDRPAEPSMVQYYEDRLTSAQNELREHRARMMRKGLTPPDLPDTLLQVDADGISQRVATEVHPQPDEEGEDDG